MRTKITGNDLEEFYFFLKNLPDNPSSELSFHLKGIWRVLFSDDHFETEIYSGRDSGVRDTFLSTQCYVEIERICHCSNLSEKERL